MDRLANTLLALGGLLFVCIILLGLAFALSRIIARHTSPDRFRSNAKSEGTDGPSESKTSPHRWSE